MSGSTGKEENSWGRASEINDAMLGIQPYADDSMFFIIRYGNKAKTSMRAKDYSDFMKSLEGMMQLWTKPAEAVGGAQERSRKASELRQTCLDLVKGFPDLERDFDRFVTASRSTMRAMNPSQV